MCAVSMGPVYPCSRITSRWLAMSIFILSSICRSFWSSPFLLSGLGYPLYNSILGIPQTSTVTILGLTFQPNCKFSTHLKEKLCKANKCLYVIRCLRKEGCSQAEVDHLFSSIVLPNIAYASSVYGASESELTIAQQFLD